MEKIRKEFVKIYIYPVTDNARIRKAFMDIPREIFLPKGGKDHAYEDRAYPIGEDQTISQPSLVAIMTDELDVNKSHKVLEIGTGSGFQAAILAKLAKEVYTVEIRQKLAQKAEKVLSKLELTNVHVIVGNGTIGYEKQAPYDRIIVTAGARKIPQTLINQLKPKGKIVIPQGESLYDLKIIIGTKSEQKIIFEEKEGVQFVPLIGKHGGWEN